MATRVLWHLRKQKKRVAAPVKRPEKVLVVLDENVIATTGLDVVLVLQLVVKAKIARTKPREVSTLPIFLLMYVFAEFVDVDFLFSNFVLFAYR